MFLQSLRTPAQLEERLRIIEKFSSLQIAGERVRQSLTSPDNVREVQAQIRIFAKEFSVLADLKPVLLVNKTDSSFLTSDNPAMVINRLSHQRFGTQTGGLIQSGCVALMPLSPSLAMLAYDADVYRSIGTDDHYELTRQSDVERFNELQIIRAHQAIFFSRPNDAAYVRKLFQKYQKHRRSDWSVLRIYIRDGEDEEFERFRLINEGDRDSLEPRVQMMSPILPAPSTWPTFLKLKMRPKGWTNGTIVGFVREAHTKRGRGFREEVLPSRLPKRLVDPDVIFERKSKPPSSRR